MSRFDGDSSGDVYDILAWGGHEWNLKQHIKGPKGQKILLELEEALLSLPQKRLIKGELARVEINGDNLDESVQCCVIGALALKKNVPVQVMVAADSDYDRDLEQQSIEVAKRIGMIKDLAIELAYVNDELQWSINGYKKETPEERYVRVLGWVQERILR